MHKTWRQVFESELSEPYFQALVDFVRSERVSHQVYPPPQQVFAAFDTPFDCVKAVILGQDPYHGPGQAHGLAFSVQPGIPIPPSLANIYAEMREDLGVKTPSHGCLRALARRGVLLLNTTLTVRSGSPTSHAGRGWERFTARAMKALGSREEPMAFILWGKHAQGHASLVSDRHAVIVSAHPSPMSANRGFFGSKPFSRTNLFLTDRGIAPIDWVIPDDPNAQIETSPPVCRVRPNLAVPDDVDFSNL